MRVAVVGDVHGNLEALEAVLARADELGAQQLVCVGDVVGYGANPRECLATVRARTGDVVGGNHDFGAVGKCPLEYFNSNARLAIEWTAQQLSEEERRFLCELPLVRELPWGSLVHGSFLHPEQFPYIFRVEDAAASFAQQPSASAFCGHTHLPGTFLMEEEVRFLGDPVVHLADGHKRLMNCGSVGQPRDGDSDASFALLDTEDASVEFHRVAYDIETAANKILSAGLPAFLAQRLTLGY